MEATQKETLIFIINRDKEFRQKLRSFVNKYIPKELAILRSILFREIDKLSPENLEKFRNELVELTV